MYLDRSMKCKKEYLLGRVYSAIKKELAILFSNIKLAFDELKLHFMYLDRVTNCKKEFLVGRLYLKIKEDYQFSVQTLN